MKTSRQLERSSRLKRGLIAALVIGAALGAFLASGDTGAPDEPLTPTDVEAPPPGRPATAPDDVIIANAKVELHVGASDVRAGALTVIDKASGKAIGENLGQSIVFPGADYHLPGDLQPAGSPDLSSADTLLGPGQVLHIPYTSTDGVLIVDFYAVLPDEADSFFLQLAVRTTTEDLTPDRIVYFRMPEGDAGRLEAGERTTFLSDATRRLDHELDGDGEVNELTGLGSPVYVSMPGGRAIVMAWLDEPAQWPLFSLRRSGQELHLSFETGALGRLADRSNFVDFAGAAWSPRLMFDVTAADTRVAFEDYKRVMAVLYPQPALPDWFGPQWDSYWVYDLDINEGNTLANANAIDAQFRDLGPWSIIFDAGWYVDGGRPNSAPDVLDYDKFPNGLAPVTSYLRSRNIRSIMYFSAPYVDYRVAVDPAGFAGPPPWMALSGFIDRYPDYVKSLSLEADGPSYVYDFLNPGMQGYLRSLMRFYLNELGGDGILLDLIGEAGPAVADEVEDDRAPGGRVPLVARQSIEVYRSVWEAALAAKPDALVEGSWLDPPLARAYSQTWRYGDEVEAFSFAYPYNGLVQKLDYVILQRQMLGVRPHIGYLRGPGTATQIQQWWMGAGLALGAEFAMAVDFTEMTPAAAETYRSYLAHYQPFSGFTFFGPGGLTPYWFATTRDGVTYLGLVNRGEDALDITVPLTELGLANGRQVIAYDPEADDARFVNGSLAASLPGQSFRLLVLRDTPGSVWGSRRTTEVTDGTVTTIAVQRSPLETGGRLMVYVPGSMAEVEGSDYSIDSTEARFQRVSFATGDPAEVRLVPPSPSIGP